MAEETSGDGAPSVYALGVPISCGDITFVSEEAKAEFMAWVAADSDSDATGEAMS